MIVQNVDDTYYAFSIRTLCLGITCIYVIAGVLCAAQTYCTANYLITQIHFWGSLLLPLFLLFYKAVVWYKEANKSYLLNNPVVDFDLEYGNVLVFALALIFCILQVTALINIVLFSINKSNSIRI